tara:strand:+ start:285 stop:563 length:279 start_codon:yes stop_codon:yes gene_type:complete
MKRKNINKPTTNELASMVSQLSTQSYNNQEAIYNAVEIITSYIEMKGDTQKFAEFRSKRFGLGAESESKISRIYKYLKNKVLTAKKSCCFWK